MGFCSCITNLLGGIFKYFIFIFNLIFVLAGIALLVLGILIEVKVIDLSESLDINIHVSAIILMAGGSVAIVISFLGCCGAIRNSTCLLNMYAASLLLAFSLQIAGAVFVFVQNPQVLDEVETEMRNLISHYPLPSQEGETGEIGETAKMFWDTTQTYLECCGIRSKLDWNVYVPGLSGLPDSCNCSNSQNYWYECDAEDFYATGCYYRLKDIYFDLQEVMAWVAIAVAAFELAVGILTLIYANTGGSRKRHELV